MTGANRSFYIGANPKRPPPTYIERAISDECAKVVAAPAHQANDALNRAAAALGQMVGADWVDRETAEQRLEEAATQHCNDTFEALATIKSGLDWGQKNPRDVNKSHAPASIITGRQNKTAICPGDKQDRALAIWRNAAPATGSLVQTYLEARSIHGPIPASIRFSKSITMPKGGSHPAMIAKIEHPITHDFCGVQGTALAANGLTKAEIKNALTPYAKFPGSNNSCSKSSAATATAS